MIETKGGFWKMKLISIEPTPSPNSMKINLDEQLPAGIQRTYTSKTAAKAPLIIQKLLQIEGLKSVFHTSDFMAVDRKPNADWKQVLSEVVAILGDPSHLKELDSLQSQAEEDFGEVRVFIQTFRHIPMQIRIKSGTQEVRRAMPERFIEAAMKAGSASPNLIKERKLEERGVRYGDLEQIADEVMDELEASLDEEQLMEIVKKAEQMGPGEEEPFKLKSLEPKQVEALLQSDEDWRKRYAAFERLKASSEVLPIIAQALKDSNASIRRLAVVYLGDIKTPEVLQLLTHALEDASAAVRRTAGDTLSDIGDPEAMGAMAEALKDKNKLVRWRAARFLYEFGDASVLEPLKTAEEDPEFEVSMQVQMAIARIERGEEAEGSVWQQMTKHRQS
jgi:hypothetical protein